MLSQVRMYASACFYYIGIVKLARWWAQRSGPRLIILYYHQASRGDLRSHWLYLCRHYRILPLEKALEELYMPRTKGSRTTDQRSLLALTFDDGYSDNYTHAFSLARELQLPITIFLISGYMEGGNAFWWATRLIRLAQVERVKLDGRSYRLDDQEERRALAQAVDASFSRCASSIEREKFLSDLYKTLEIPSSVALKETPVSLLTWEQAREMQASGLVSFGAHTVHHPDLAALTDPAEVQREVVACRPVLEQQLGRSIHSFAYPFGGVGDNGLRAVKQAGFDWAVTTLPGDNTHLSDPHLLRRRNMGDYKHWLVVAAEAAGIWGFFSHLKRGLIHKFSFRRT